MRTAYEKPFPSNCKLFSDAISRIQWYSMALLSFRKNEAFRGFMDIAQEI